MLPLPKENSLTPAENRSDRGKKRPNRKLAETNPLDILLVDDNAVNVLVGKRILEMFGYKNVASAGDGQQAIDESEKKRYDLILLDLQMPVVDGFTAHRRIRASPLSGDPCIVALTANADQATQQICEEEGFWGYLSKPLDIPRLERILGEVGEFKKKNRVSGATSNSGPVSRSHSPTGTGADTPSRAANFQREGIPVRTNTVQSSEQGQGAAPGSKEMTMSEVRNARRVQLGHERDEKLGKEEQGEGMSAREKSDEHGKEKNAKGQKAEIDQKAKSVKHHSSEAPEAEQKMTKGGDKQDGL